MARLLNTTDWSEQFLFGNKNVEQHNNCKPNQLSRLSFGESRLAVVVRRQSSRVLDSKKVDFVQCPIPLSRLNSPNSSSVCSFHLLLQNSVSSALSIPLTVWLHGTRRDGTLSPYSLWLLSALPMALSCVRPQSEGHRLLAPARAAWLPHRPRPRWTLVSSTPPAPRQLLPSPRRADFVPCGPFGRP